jgi:hypothetical protein
MRAGFQLRNARQGDIALLAVLDLPALGLRAFQVCLREGWGGWYSTSNPV